MQFLQCTTSFCDYLEILWYSSDDLKLFIFLNCFQVMINDQTKESQRSAIMDNQHITNYTHFPYSQNITKKVNQKLFIPKKRHKKQKNKCKHSY